MYKHLPFKNTFRSKVGRSAYPDSTNCGCSKASRNILLRNMTEKNMVSIDSRATEVVRNKRNWSGWEILTIQLEEYDATRSPAFTPCLCNAETKAATSS